jgi:hypothetical protein
MVLTILAVAVSGVSRHGLTGDGIRVATLISCAALTVGATTRLADRWRLWVVDAIVLLGTVHAGITVAVLAWGAVAAGPPAPAVWSSGLQQSPNTLAALLAATSAITLRRLDHRQGPSLPVPWLRAMLAAQVVGVAATGSRFGAICVAAILLVSAMNARLRMSRGVLAGIGLASLAAGLVTLATTPTERVGIWAQAVRRLADAPWVGAAGDVPPFTGSSELIPSTTHAHNEVLQLAVEFGVPTTLGLVAVAAAWVAWRWSKMDRALLVPAAIIVGSGLIDVTLRSTPVLAIMALCAGAAAATERSGADETTADETTGGETTARERRADRRRSVRLPAISTR